MTGAVLPAFNNPLKLAGELAMLDALCNGRLDIGFARAFLPLEFSHFGVKLDESRARFEEGMEQVRLLLEQENVSSVGRFHSFHNVTSLPRPAQLPRPPFYVAALATKKSFERAGAAGHGVMAIPMAGCAMAELIGIYRNAWARAGHRGNGTVMLAFHMLCHRDQNEAERIAREPINRYLRSLVHAASEWLSGESSADYPGYDKIIAGLASETFETQVAKFAAWVGTPQRILDTVSTYRAQIGDFEIASLQVNFNDVGARRRRGLDAPVRRARAAQAVAAQTIAAQHASRPTRKPPKLEPRSFRPIRRCGPDASMPPPERDMGSVVGRGRAGSDRPCDTQIDNSPMRTRKCGGS